MGFTKKQIELMELIHSFFTSDKVEFIKWNFKKIGSTGGGNVEGWLERELDFYLEKHGFISRPKKQLEADLMFETNGKINWEISIEIRTGSHPSSFWMLNKIIINKKRLIHPLYLYLFVPSQRTLNRIYKETQNMGMYVKEYHLDENLMLLFIY